MLHLFSIAALCDDPLMCSQFSTDLLARAGIVSPPVPLLAPLTYSVAGTATTLGVALLTLNPTNNQHCPAAVVRAASRAIFSKAGARLRIGWVVYHSKIISPRGTEMRPVAGRCCCKHRGVAKRRRGVRGNTDNSGPAR